jgi:hypothetical protein
MERRESTCISVKEGMEEVHLSSSGKVAESVHKKRDRECGDKKTGKDYCVSRRLHYLNISTKMKNVYLSGINIVPFHYCITNCPFFIKKLK